MTVACEDDEEEEEENTLTNWSYTDQKEITDYLVSRGTIDSYFQDEKFTGQTKEEQNIGNACFCYGPQCDYAGYERPELQTEMVTRNGAKVQAGKLFGCDGVPEEYNGAIRGCFRTSDVKNIKPAIYFPYGTCALVMSKCTPSEKCYDGFDTDVTCTPEVAKLRNEKTICGFAKFGDYDQVDSFTSCPSEDVLLDFVMNIHLAALGRAAKLDVRGCFPGCKEDTDCHGYGVNDPATNLPSQLKCMETAPNADGTVAKVCFDQRSIQDTDTKVLTLVNPGKWAVEK